MMAIAVQTALLTAHAQIRVVQPGGTRRTVPEPAASVIKRTGSAVSTQGRPIQGTVRRWISTNSIELEASSLDGSRYGLGSRGIGSVSLMIVEGIKPGSVQEGDYVSGWLVLSSPAGLRLVGLTQEGKKAAIDREKLKAKKAN
jgi:hypothetical protein